ncbi:trehalose-phosphatase [Candidatus Entotheonella serta]|nr:trehalose-phosphatase [Candidatus Entotheonella serta]
MPQGAGNAKTSKLCIISNRLPITIRHHEMGELAIERSSGGLAAALANTHDTYDSVWIGWPGSQLDDPDAQTRVSQLLEQEHRSVPIFLKDCDIERFYHGFSNSALWPLFHYFETFFNYDEEAWESYVQVNRRFCDAVLREVDSDTLIWVHDYHLFLLPGMLREHLPEARIGFFLHIPFPSSEMFRVLPCREALLRGLLEADLVGFQTFGYLQNFLWSVYRVLGLDAETGYLPYGGRQVKFGVHPIGIKPEQFLHAIHHDAETGNELARLDSSIGSRKLLLGMDRMDYSKGIPARLRAYKRFLDSHPEWHERVTLMQVAVPSREQVMAYQNLKLAGASAELGEAFFVNPYDTEGMAERLHEVLSLPEDVLAERMATLHKRVCTHTVDRWANKFLSTLKSVQFAPRTRPLAGSDRQRLLSAAARAERRVLLLDYDGTLAPLVPLPHRATPSPEVLSLLQRLQQDSRNVLAEVSSRDRLALERWLGACGCILVAEHGAWFNTDGTWTLSHELSDDWKGTIRPILERVVEQTPGSLLEEKDYSLVWHYRLTDPEFGLWQARELCSQLQGMLAGSELQVQNGNKVVVYKRF